MIPTLAVGCLAATPLVGQVAEGPYPMPAPRFRFEVDSNVSVAMRDGIRLATDLYRPVDAGDRLPVILIRTPYNKAAMPYVTEPARFFAGQGYLVATQDIRGKFRSEGEFAVQMKDAEDGYDTIDWLARQAWSTGKVGTYGCSYMGEVQLLAAKLRHPAHTAMIAQSASGAMGPAGGFYTNWGTYEGGTITLSALFGWMGGAGSKVRGRTGDLASLDFPTMLRSLPLATMADRAGYPPSDFRDFVTHKPADPYWDQMGYIRDHDRFDVPTLHVNSWFDVTPEQTLYLAELMRRNGMSPRGRDNQFVIMSPTEHCRSEAAGASTTVGERGFGDARLPYFQIYLDWFDHWLKGADNGVTSRPKYQYYLMGRNEWRSAPEWPVPGTTQTPYYLTGASESDRGERRGGLSTALPPAGSDRFRYDPADPFPSRGGTVCCTGNPKDQPGAFDQADLESRADLLSYTTAPLERGLTVVGAVKAVLFVSSDARDTDFTAKLLDVDQDGRAWNVASGVLRARYREGMTREVWLSPGQVTRVEVSLKATAHHFAPGHRLRLWISGSEFPLHDRNLNTGGDNVTEIRWVVANNTVHRGGATPSQLLLPIVDEGSAQDLLLGRIRPDWIRPHVGFLAAAELRGRETGQPGAEVAARYVSAELEQLGLRALSPRDGYLPQVPLRYSSVRPEVTSARLTTRGRTAPLEYGKDYFVHADKSARSVEQSAPLAFVGWGVSAPAHGYDDYQGIDVRGRLVVTLFGGPSALPPDIRAHYAALAMKERTALAHGAVGMVTLFPGPAEVVGDKLGQLEGFGWLDETGEPHSPFFERGPAVRLTDTGTDRLLQIAGRSLSEIVGALERGPSSFPIDATLELQAGFEHRELQASNAGAVLEGSDPALADEYVVYTAHLDHVGVGTPVDGDSVYHGAIDNAGGTAVLLALARAYAELPRPRRSVIFLAVTGEEKGILGSDYFARNPPVPAASIVANVNLDNFVMTNPVRDFVAYGAEYSTLDEVAKAAFARLGVEGSEDPLPEMGIFTRSDHYPFMQRGIPGLMLFPGRRSGDGARDGRATQQAWFGRVHHTPRDTFEQGIDWRAGVTYAEANLLIGYHIATATERPRWRGRYFFHDAERGIP
ncbi:MAG: CocE/NonD family hydrolase [Gemmatimonadales bacterium]